LGGWLRMAVLTGMLRADPVDLDTRRRAGEAAMGSLNGFEGRFSRSGFAELEGNRKSAPLASARSAEEKLFRWVRSRRWRRRLPRTSCRLIHVTGCRTLFRRASPS